MTQTTETMQLVAPDVAQAWLDHGQPEWWQNRPQRLAHTVATEPERIAEAERRGAVKALRTTQREYERIAKDRTEGPTSRSVYGMLADKFEQRANAIENGADL